MVGKCASITFAFQREDHGSIFSNEQHLGNRCCSMWAKVVA